MDAAPFPGNRRPNDQSAARMATKLGFDLHTLEIFTAVCEARSMTRAAKQLGLTQPAVSHAIRQLEEAMDVALIDRAHRPLTPTTSGYWLAGAAAKILQDTHQIPLALRHLDKGLAVRLRIGIVDSLAVPFVPLMVRRLKRTIHYLSITSGLSRTLWTELVEHRLDLIITNEPRPAIDGIVTHPVLSEPYVLVAPRSLSDGRLSGGLSGLAQTLPLIRWNAQSNIAKDIETQLRRMQIDIGQRFAFDHPGTILSLVAEGLGWAIMTPLSIFGLAPLLSRVSILPFPGPAFSRRLDLFARRGEIDTIAARITEVSRGILQQQYLPRVQKIAPWLANEFVVAAE
jgi:DNA-binding transcriptional LysR family regulator